MSKHKRPKVTRYIKDGIQYDWHPATGWFNSYDFPISNPKRPDATPLSASAWATARLHFTPDPRQREILDSASNRILVNCSRQWGKSTTAAIKALHHALHTPNSLTILLSPSARQSSELFGKVKHFLATLNLPLKPGNRNPNKLRLDNGARIVALPGNEATIRGFSAVSLLIIDEAARVPDPLYAAARPFLATTNGTLLVMSTPKGQSGFFYREWVSDHPWLRITVPATDCPRISKEFLDAERAQTSDRFFRQEYLCDFLGAKTNLFTAELLAQLHTNSLDPFLLKP